MITTTTMVAWWMFAIALAALLTLSVLALSAVHGRLVCRTGRILETLVRRVSLLLANSAHIMRVWTNSGGGLCRGRRYIVSAFSVKSS
ncbi:MAG: hypothetical protein GY894_10425 [Planctomycetes bacterium]|nr:hypothetical protein [Planctomycetota bacterium]